LPVLPMQPAIRLVPDFASYRFAYKHTYISLQSPQKVCLERDYPHFSSTTCASNFPSACTISNPTVTGSRKRLGPHDPGLK